MASADRRWFERRKHARGAGAVGVGAAMLAGRMDRLAAFWTTWRPAVLVSLAAIFEVYDLYQTAYVPPGLVRSGIFNTGGGKFGLSDQAVFAS